MGYPFPWNYYCPLRPGSSFRDEAERNRSIETKGACIYTLIPITRNISIDEKEIEEEFVLSSGPGGQNVNKVATAVQLRFDVRNSPSLPEDVRERLISLAGRRVNRDGVLIIKARRFRAQDKNRRDAINRLVDLIKRAVRTPKPRRKTRPTRASNRRRLEIKRHHSDIKRRRRPVTTHEE